jgi:hypothetical protein
MRNIFLVCFLIIIGFFCKKPDFDDLSGDKKFNGKAILIKSLESTKDTVILQSKVIHLRYADKNEDEFLYSGKTDNAGRFEFKNLSNEKRYIVHARESVDNLPYYGELDISTGNVLYLYPDNKKITGLILNLLDTTNSVYSIVNSQKVYRFSSRLFFDSLATNRAMDSLITGSDGQIKYLNQLPGIYYFYSSMIVNSDTFSGKKQIIIPSSGIKRDTLFSRKQ